MSVRLHVGQYRQNLLWMHHRGQRTYRLPGRQVRQDIRRSGQVGGIYDRSRAPQLPGTVSALPQSQAQDLLAYIRAKELYPDFTAKNYPNAETQYSQTISIPLYPDMPQEQVDYVINTVIKIGTENHV